MYNRQKKAIARRVNVISRLETQLESKNKTTKEGIVALSDTDVTRIKKEIEILKGRL